MNFARIGFLVVCASLTFGCAEQVEQASNMNDTQKGAIAGGAMGGVLGAIVGNQTGSTQSGLVVGTLAGAAAGGSVGYVLDEQNNSVKKQGEEIEKRDQALKVQGQEIENLRQSSHDSISFRGDNRVAANTYQGNAYQAAPSTYSSGTTQAAPVHEATLPVGTAVVGAAAVGSAADTTSPDSPTKPASGTDGFAPRLSNDGPTNSTNNSAAAPALAVAATTNTNTAAADTTDSSSRAAYTWNSNAKPDLSSPDCIKSQSEVKDAAAASENADKLFHYRRAIRLCPNNPAHHNALGQVYLSLDRKSDAEFEFKEALNVDSNYEPAKKNLSNIKH